MATKGYSFQDDEKTMDTEKCTVFLFWNNFFYKNFKFQSWLNVFVGEKWRILSCLTKLLTDEIF